jgi:hypothetical protein
VGEYLVLLVKAFDLFAGVNPYANFSINIKPEEGFGFYVKRPPYFKPPLET